MWSSSEGLGSDSWLAMCFSMIDLAVGAKESISFRIRAIIGTMAFERRWGGGVLLIERRLASLSCQKQYTVAEDADPHLA